MYFLSSSPSGGWSSCASSEKLVFTGEVSLLGFGVGVELRSCFNKAFWVCISGCCPADISVGFNTTEGFEGSDVSAEDNREEELARRVGTAAP